CEATDHLELLLRHDCPSREPCRQDLVRDPEGRDFHHATVVPTRSRCTNGHRPVDHQLTVGPTVRRLERVRVGSRARDAHEGYCTTSAKRFANSSSNQIRFCESTFRPSCGWPPLGLL